MKQPVSVHLAGQSRDEEIKEFKEKERKIWHDKVVVEDTIFHIHRHSIKTENAIGGPNASTQIDKLKGLLKDKPKKISLQPSEHLRVDNIPMLGLIRLKEEHDEDAIVGYHPGPNLVQSLKRDSNVVPVYRTVEPDCHHGKSFVT